MSIGTMIADELEICIDKVFILSMFRNRGMQKGYLLSGVFRSNHVLK